MWALTLKFVGIFNLNATICLLRILSNFTECNNEILGAPSLPWAVHERGYASPMSSLPRSTLSIFRFKISLLEL